MKMKIALIISIFNLVTGCSSSDKSSNAKGSNTDTLLVSNKDTFSFVDSSNKELLKEVTITVSYAAIACGCPQWFETKYKDVDFLKGVERFYLEPVNKDLINANSLWDGEDLPLTIKITGKFSKEKGIPVSYNTKGVPEKARIFWYEKITVLSPVKK